MPHPTQGYRNKDGKLVPGVTTILSRFKESGALITWAYNRGREGLELYESRDRAAELGTIVHSMVEEYIKRNDPLILIENIKGDDRNSVLSAFNAFGEWFESNRFEIIAQEKQLISEIYQYGGTPDAIAKDSKGRLVLLDWKTSNGIYPDHLYQAAAYRILWNENNLYYEPLTGGTHICRFSKEHGDFAHHSFPNLDKEEEAFICFRKAYEIDKETKKRC